MPFCSMKMRAGCTPKAMALHFTTITYRVLIMNICTITCHNANNHGARLQTFALAEYLRGMGHNVQVIDYQPPYMHHYGSVWYNPGLNLAEWAKLFLFYRKRARNQRRLRIMSDFSDRYIPTTPQVYLSYEALRSHPPRADVYIAGSDQIWNTSFPNGTDPAFYLDFAPADALKLSYAASFATSAIPDAHRDFVRRGLANFDAVSVRETSAVDIAGGLGREAAQVVDPVFLLSPDFWSGDFMGKAEVAHPYLLVYDFERNDSVRQVAQRVAKLRGLRIYSVSPTPLGYADRSFVACSPNDFVALVHGASCVISNSFHGTVFAMIFGRDFYMVPRADGLNQRMSDLLAMYGLTGRIVMPDAADGILLSPIDYAPVHSKLRSDISRSKFWLKSHLSK